jgi:hypothetical protein
MKYCGRIYTKQDVESKESTMPEKLWKSSNSSDESENVQIIWMYFKRNTTGNNI